MTKKTIKKLNRKPYLPGGSVSLQVVPVPEALPEELLLDFTTGENSEEEEQEQQEIDATLDGLTIPNNTVNKRYFTEEDKRFLETYSLGVIELSSREETRRRLQQIKESLIKEMGGESSLTVIENELIESFLRASAVEHEIFCGLLRFGAVRYDKKSKKIMVSSAVEKSLVSVMSQKRLILDSLTKAKAVKKIQPDNASLFEKAADRIRPEDLEREMVNMDRILGRYSGRESGVISQIGGE